MRGGLARELSGGAPDCCPGLFGFRPSTCPIGSCLSAALKRRTVYLICACLKVLTCPLLSPPVRSCPEGGLGLT